MNEPQATTVDIFGREYKIKGADEKYVRSVAKYVDDKMKEVSKDTALSSQDRLAILAAMEIAHELFQVKREQSDNLSNIERKAESMISLLDEGLRTRD
jgi:cell division protein ZapA